MSPLRPNSTAAALRKSCLRSALHAHCQSAERPPGASRKPGRAEVAKDRRMEAAAMKLTRATLPIRHAISLRALSPEDAGLRPLARSSATRKPWLRRAAHVNDDSLWVSSELQSLGERLSSRRRPPSKRVDLHRRKENPVAAAPLQLDSLTAFAPPRPNAVPRPASVQANDVENPISYVERRFPRISFKRDVPSPV